MLGKVTATLSDNGRGTATAAVYDLPGLPIDSRFDGKLFSKTALQNVTSRIRKKTVLNNF